MEPRGLSYCKEGWSLQMMPVGYLMIEHRLIERMVKLLKGERERIKTKKADLKFLEAAVDFIRTYADKCHHGKEEDILFKEMLKKKITPAHRRVIARLIKEHKMGRATVKNLIFAKEAYAKGRQEGLKGIKKQLDWLINFYPRHIAKEDRGFFIPAMAYFNKKEQDSMLREFCLFDKSGIQEKYRKSVTGLEKRAL